MVNKVILVGRLGKDPEIKSFENDVKVASFTLATDESYKDRSGERVDKTEWHNVAVWRKQAEIAEQYLRKGSLIYLEGKLKTRSYDDKDGNKKFFTEVVADFFRMLSSKKEDDARGDGGGYNNNQNERSSVSQNMDVDDEPSDDLPF